METVIINGKEFELNRITLADNAKILHCIGRKDVQFFSRKDWKQLCNVALKKEGVLWKWFGWLPKELQWKKVLLSDAGGLQVDFFAYYKAGLEGQMKRLKDSGIINPNVTKSDQFQENLQPIT